MALSFSRFRRSDLIKTRDGAETYGRMEVYGELFRNLSGDNVFEWKVQNNFEGRPDLIAYDFYGVSHYEWIIVFANRPKNPLNWPKTGDVIKIPSREFIRSIL
jgi:hypothetical protein